MFLEFKVTKDVLRLKQKQITVTGLPPHKDGNRSKSQTSNVTITLPTRKFTLISGDTHAFWRNHQDEAGKQNFDLMYAKLSETPDQTFKAECEVTDNTSATDLSSLLTF